MNNYLHQNELDVRYHLKKVLKHLGKICFIKYNRLVLVFVFDSTDQSVTNDYISTCRNTQLTYEDISINDILLVSWGIQGTNQYPARCIEKNNENKELLIHYTRWNSR